MEEENMLMTPTLESATPRSLLQHVLVPTEVQATVKAHKQRKRRSGIRDVNSKRVSSAFNDENTESLDVSITPRTALLGTMNASNLMKTVHHPKRRKVSPPPEEIEVPQHSSSLIQSTEVEESAVHSRLQAFRDFPQSQPVISTDEYSRKLKVKLAEFKKAKAEAAVLRNQSQLTEKSIDITVPSDDKSNKNTSTLQASDEKNADQSHEQLTTAENVLISSADSISFVENTPAVNNQSKLSASIPEHEDVCPSSADNSLQTDQDPLQVSSLHAASKSAVSLIQEDINENEVTDIIPDEEVISRVQQIQANENKQAEAVPRHVGSSDQSAIKNPVPKQPLASKPIKKVLKPSLNIAHIVKNVSPKRRTSRTDIPISSAQLKGMVQHFSTRNVSKEAMEEIEKVYGKFFRNLTEDLEAACVHAKRKKITHEDMELIMKRQKHITESRPLKVLIEENFPLEYQDILIPVAKSCQVSTQRQEEHLEPKGPQKK